MTKYFKHIDDERKDIKYIGHLFAQNFPGVDKKKEEPREKWFEESLTRLIGTLTGVREREEWASLGFDYPEKGINKEILILMPILIGCGFAAGGLRSW